MTSPKTSSKAKEKEKTTALCEQLSFEDALEELEIVVSKLETGRVPLEESLALLRRGTALIERCEGELNSAEVALEQLIATPDGELQTVSIGVEDDDE